MPSHAFRVTALVLVALSAHAWAQPVASGSYVGNGIANRSISVGFQPAFVILKGNQLLGGMARTASMGGDASKCLNCSQLLEAGAISALTATGFRLGDGDRANNSGVIFYWTAFAAVAGELTTGSYTGNGADGRAIGVGFAPDGVIVFPNAPETSTVRFSSMPGNTSYTLGTGSAATRITALTATGFTVGPDVAVNGNGTSYHWVAFRNAEGRTGVGSYAGNGADNRAITGLGFTPTFLLTRIGANARGVFRNSALGGDSTMPIDSNAIIANAVQALQTDGFQVGSSAEVNGAGSTYYYAAFGFTPPGPPTAISNGATGIGLTTATLNGRSNPKSLSTSGYFRYSTTNPGACNDSFGTRAPGSGGSALGSGTATLPYSQSLSGLSTGATYYFCAIASNSAGTSFGAVQTFVLPGPPSSVTTEAATAVTSTGATLNGSAVPAGATTTGWFRYSATNPGTCNDAFGTRAPGTGGTALGSGTGAVAYSRAISGLTAGTPYYFCAIANNAQGTSVGSVVTVIPPAAPTVTTSAATAVSTTSATLHGSATPRGAATTGYFRYSTTNPGTCNDAFGTRAPGAGGSALGAGSGAVAYSQGLTGLTGGATYYFCAIATNSQGMALGAVQSFLTPQPPAMTTLAAGSVGGVSANLQGRANPRGATTTGWFRYSTANPGSCNDAFGTRAPATGGTAAGAGTADVPYNNVVSGLTPGATYFFCAIGNNSQGTAFGTVLSFTTPLAPDADTTAATLVSGTGATLNGIATPGGATATGWFRYSPNPQAACDDSFGVRIPGTGGFALGSGGAPVTFSQALSDLLPGTLYRFCALASNSQGTSFGALLTFATPGPNGGPCTVTGQCQSGQCVDGVCCNSSCAGGCVACNLAGAAGTCTPRPDGTDPEASCGSGVCGGACDGAGLCRYPTSACGVCQVCNGAGACTAAANGASCADAAYCNGDERCVAGACAPATPVTCPTTSQDILTCDEPLRLCTPDPRVPPIITRDAQTRAAVGMPYLYNAFGAVTVRGASPMTFGRCGGPPEFRVESASGAVVFVPNEPTTLGLCVFAENANGRDEYSFTLDVSPRPSPLSPPTARLQVSPRESQAPHDVDFTSRDSAAGSSPLTLARWSFTDSRAVVSGEDVTQRFLLPGAYWTELTVADEQGQMDRVRGELKLMDRDNHLPPSAKLIAQLELGSGAANVQLSCECSRGEGELVAYRWSLSDGRVLEGPSVSTTLPVGRHHVVLEVTDAYGLRAFDRAELNVPLGTRQPPECAVTLDPPSSIGSGLVFHRAHFHDADGTVVSHAMTVDQMSVASAGHSYAYRQPGTYKVQLNVRDDDGLECADLAFVRIAAADGSEAPNLVTLPSQRAACGTPFVYSPTSDQPIAAGSPPFRWSFVTPPPVGMIIVPETGELRWTPARTEKGQAEMTIRVENSAGYADQPLAITVDCESVPLGVGCGCSQGAERFGLFGWALALWLLRARRHARATD